MYASLYLSVQTRAFRCKHKGPEKGETLEMAQLSGRSLLCNRACRFAFPNEPAVYCAKHKLEGMVDVLNPRCNVSVSSGYVLGNGEERGRGGGGLCSVAVVLSCLGGEMDVLSRLLSVVCCLLVD